MQRCTHISEAQQGLKCGDPEAAGRYLPHPVVTRAKPVRIGTSPRIDMT